MRKRLDTAMTESGLFESRSRAAAAVMAGTVRVGGQLAKKPGQMVTGDEEITVDGGPEFVSRGGTKLANALDALGLDVAGRQALDVGASTGGFPDCPLPPGGGHVGALGGGGGELAWGIRQGERGTPLGRAKARAPEAGPPPP